MSRSASDHSRSVLSNSTGRYDFGNVPEGTHEVGLDLEQLPTNYEPGTATQERLTVNPRAIARADFNVVPLTALYGKIVTPPGTPIDNILIRLEGSKRYTTPYQDGTFYFYNLREGDYNVVIDPQTIPAGYLLASPASVHVSPRNYSAPPRIEFELKAKPEAVKPVRDILQQQIHVGGESVPNQPNRSARTGHQAPKKGGSGHAAHGAADKRAGVGTVHGVGARSGNGVGQAGAGGGGGG